ncbi:hypothetical protein Acr_04g0001580 [Actinidia rufa]|uniref:Uncharacterized protein n=1 Tax=Actinidia rufa TaxID=165716 RepID=A0A7J0EGA4_9ERIC|nr:hypothetical protein Acr_04g0001580 [Actinidia rufa]
MILGIGGFSVLGNSVLSHLETKQLIEFDGEFSGNKFDGEISAFPVHDGSKSVDLKVVWMPGKMAVLDMVACGGDWWR